jgi:hypothetical protein
VSRLLTKGVFPGGPRRIWHFLRSFPLRRPSLVPTMIADWIAGLSMRKFASDHLWSTFSADLRIVEAARAAIQRYLRQGEVWISRQTADLPSLNIRLGDELNRRFFRKAAPQLKKLMKQSQSQITLAIDEMPSEYIRQLEKLLRRLAKHGDRIVVELSEATRQRLSLDLSAFHLVLVPAAAIAG